MKQRMQKVLDYIEENLKTVLEAEELADMAGYSLFHFYRLFQAATGMPVMQYILRRRLIHAIYEMQGKQKRVDIMLDYGFETYAGFYRAFRNMFHCTPSCYLKKGRAKRPYPIRLDKEEAMHIHHKKAREILKHWHLENEPLQDIYYDGTGNKNENAYLVGERYVLKFTANPGNMQRHQHVSALLEEAGLAAAVSIKTKDGNMYVQDGDMYFYLTVRLKGTQMQAMEAYEGGKAAFIGEIIGQLHQALQKAETWTEEGNFFGDVLAWAMEKAKEKVPLTEAFCDAYRQAVIRFSDKLPKHFIHRDPNPGNIIISGDQWGFIDFELSQQSIRLYDPCYAATAILSETYPKGKKEAWFRVYQEIMAGYDRVAHLTPEEKAAAPYVVLGIQMICVAWFSQQEKFADVFAINREMTAWLVQHMEDLTLS